MKIKALLTASSLALMTATAGFASTEGADDPGAPILVVDPAPIFQTYTVTYDTGTNVYQNFQFPTFTFTGTPGSNQMLIVGQPSQFVSAVPLPAGGVLLLGGLLGMTGVSRRTKTAL